MANRILTRCAAVGLLLLAAGSLAPRATRASPSSQGRVENPAPAESDSAFAEAICLALARASLNNDLPVDFFTRLIWQESRFDPNARSYAGAQGIAQFMPATAQTLDIADPFNPFVALAASGRFLKKLRDRFGNLGLAAAAYNAGPARVEGWINNNRRPLPAQTRAYVQIITGRPAEKWVGVGDKPQDRMGNVIPCDVIAKALAPRAGAKVLPANPSELSGKVPRPSSPARSMQQGSVGN